MRIDTSGNQLTYVNRLPATFCAMSRRKLVVATTLSARWHCGGAAAGGDAGSKGRRRT